MLLCGWVWTWVHLDVHLAIFCLRKMYRALGYVSILQSCSILVLKFLNIYMNIYKYTIYWYIYTVCLYIYIYVLKKKLPAAVTFCVEYCIDRIDFLCIFFESPAAQDSPMLHFCCAACSVLDAGGGNPTAEKLVKFSYTWPRYKWRGPTLL